MKPLVSAWVGRGNYGDELLAYGLRLAICELFNVKDFVYYESGTSGVYNSRTDPDISFLHPSARRRVFRRFIDFFKLRGSDLLIFGGGSIFHSYNSINWKENLLDSYRLFSQDKMACAIGVSVGPFDDVLAERKAIQFLNKLSFIVCRDEESFVFLKKNCQRVNVFNGRDLAFWVKCARPDYFESTVERTGVGFSFLTAEKDPLLRKQKIEKMVAIVDGVIKLGKEVKLLSLYSGQKYFDDELNLEICRLCCNSSKVKVISFSGDVKEFSHQIASCEAYVTMRLHGAIAAYMAGVPFFPINGSSKLRGFYDSVNLTGGGIVDFESNDGEIVFSKVELFLNSVKCGDWSVFDCDEYAAKSQGAVRSALSLFDLPRG